MEADEAIRRLRDMDDGVLAVLIAGGYLATVVVTIEQPGTGLGAYVAAVASLSWLAAWALLLTIDLPRESPESGGNR